MGKRKVTAILALIGAVAAIAVVGNALAQTPTAAPGQAKTSYFNVFMDKLAESLGVTRDKLNSAFIDARNATVDQAVKDGKLSQQQADKIKSNSNVGPGFGFGFGWHGRVGPERGKGFMFGANVMDAVAKALGMSTQDLTSQLRSGKTLAQLAQGKEQAVKDAIVGAIKPRLDQVVSSGKMTQDQENQIISKIQSSDLSKLPWGMGPRGFRGGKSGANSGGTGSPSTSFRGAPATVGSAL